MAPAPRRLDIALALRQIAVTFAHDALPMLALGFGMIVIPAALRLVVQPSGALGTVLAVLTGLLAALYVTIVSFGAAARLAGYPLVSARYAATGIAASQPGFSVALLIGAVAVIVAIIGLLLPHANSAGAVAQAALWVAAAAALIVTLPALPAALVERLPPGAALRRGSVLTAGNRIRLTLLVLIVPCAAFGPAALLLAPADGTSLASPQLWLGLAVQLVAVAVTATVPAVAYMQLSGRAAE